jgi:hypothetical protein
MNCDKAGLIVCTRTEFVRDYLDGKVDRYERTDDDPAAKAAGTQLPWRMVHLADPTRGAARWGGEYSRDRSGEEVLGQFSIGVPWTQPS